MLTLIVIAGLFFWAVAKAPAAATQAVLAGVWVVMGGGALALERARPSPAGAAAGPP